MTFSLSRWQSDSFHSYTAPSVPAETILVSSADQWTLRTFPLWPRRLPTFSQVYALYTWMMFPLDSGEEITAVVEDALSALLDGKLLTGSNVVHQQVAHTELIRETHEDV